MATTSPLRVIFQLPLLVSILLFTVGCATPTPSGTGSLATPTSSGTKSLATPTPSTNSSPDTSILVQDSLKNIQTLYPGDCSSCCSKSDGYHVSGGCQYSNQEFENVIITVHVELIKPGRDGVSGFCGIRFREGTDESARYYFAIDTDGTWFTGDSAQITFNPAIKQGLGTMNVLQVRIKGSHPEFFVNGKKVGEMNRSLYPSGRIGFNAGTLNEAVFTDLLVTAIY